MPTPSDPTVAPTIGHAPDPVRALPGADGPFIPLTVVSDTTQTHTEGSLTFTTRTTIRSGSPRASAPSTGGAHQPSLAAAPCSLLTRDSIETAATICGGGCITQHMRRTFDRYSNPNGLPYFGRIEVRLWWSRLYDVQIYLTGPAYTEWDEGYAFDCPGAVQGRTVSNSFTPEWLSWDRTYDYY